MLISESGRMQIEAAIEYMAGDPSVPSITVAIGPSLWDVVTDGAQLAFSTITISRGEALDEVLKRVGYIDPATIDPRRQDLYIGRPDYDPYERSYSGFNYRRFDSWPKWLRDVIKYTSSTNSSHVAALAQTASAEALQGMRASLEALKELHDVRPHSVPGRERKAGLAGSLQGLGRRMVRGSRGRRGRHLYD